MRITLLIISTLFTLSLSAQTGWNRRDRQYWKEGDFAFYQGELGYANTLLQPLWEVDSTYLPLNYELGVIALDFQKDTERALRLLGNAAKGGLEESWYHYGRALHRNHQFDEAISWYQKSAGILNSGVNQKEVQRQLEISVRAKDFISNPEDVRITNLGPNVNTEAKEYVPLVTPDNEQIYFTSRRDDSTARLKDPNGEYFEDIYRSGKDSISWTKGVNLGQPINSETHDATVSITADGKTMLLYRTNRNLTGGDLYISERKGNSWSEPKKLPSQINSEFQEASATLSPDKRTLIFSSDRPGGYGGKDLYRVRRLPNGQWSLPRNLGPSINTEYNEDAPHMDVDGQTLYFASEGHSTIGGYDLFRAEKTGDESWSTPENLGYPTNTVEDDIFLTVDAGGRRGYFSSAREGGFGQQDLYSIDFIYRQQQLLVIKSEVRAVNGFPLQAEITVIDENTREVQGVYRSNEMTGKFIMILNPLTRYKVLIEHPEYETITDELYFPFPKEGEQEVTLSSYMTSRR